MPHEASEFQIPLQRLLVGLIVILVPITIFGLYMGLNANLQVQQINGTYFRTISQSSATIASSYVVERVSELVQIANEPGVQRAVLSADGAYTSMSEEAIRARSEKEEARWNTSESDALAKTILGSDLALDIRRHRELNPKLLNVVIIDQSGATIAATEKPAHYLQTATEYWRAISAKEERAVHVSDVRYDDKSREQYVTITVPVYQEGSGRFIGAITALVDVNPLFTFFNQMQFGRTGRVFLVRTDGTVVAAAGINPAERMRSEEFNAIRDALGNLQGREAGYVHATLGNRKQYLIGFADTGLRMSYPALSWIVVASQEVHEAEGPIRAMGTFAVVMTALAVILLSVLAAYVFLHRKQRLEDLADKEAEKVNVMSA